MTSRRIAEIRREAKTAANRLLIEELLIEIERLQTPVEFRLDDDHKAPNKARGTEDEFKAYARELKLTEADGEFFFNKMEAQGWTVGKKPVKDWKAQMRTWRAAGWMPSQKGAIPAPKTNGWPVRFEDFCRSHQIANFRNRWQNFEEVPSNVRAEYSRWRKAEAAR